MDEESSTLSTASRGDDGSYEVLVPIDSCTFFHCLIWFGVPPDTVDLKQIRHMSLALDLAYQVKLMKKSQSQ